MTAKELIELLSKIDPDTYVFIDSPTGEFDENDEEISFLEPVKGIDVLGKTCCIAV